MPYTIDPQVAGELGDGTVLDSSTHPPTVSKVEYILDRPDSDEFIQSFPVFLVTTDLASKMQQGGLTGFTLADVSVRPSQEYLIAYGSVPPPRYQWLRVSGIAGLDDCWLDVSYQMCVSDQMMRVLETASLSDCLVEEIDS